MKTYIVYLMGREFAMLKASGHNAAEKKAVKKYVGTMIAGLPVEAWQISVAYTEV